MQNPLIVLTFEGLTPAALSCYGSSWNHSPVIDSIAGSGAVWDRCLAISDDPDVTFHRMAEHLLSHFLGAPRSAASDTDAVELLTDVPAIAQGSSSRYFDQIDVVQDALATVDPTPSADILNTQLARLFASVIQRDAHGPAWSLLWVHSGFLTQRWDAPRDGWPLLDPEDVIDPIVAPIDPAAYDGVDHALATAVEAQTQKGQAHGTFESITPPRFQLSGGDHPDLVTSWMRTYACQIQLLDLLLETLITALEDRVPQLVLAGTSGFRLGQGGWIGHKPPQQLRSRDLHVPMIYGRCDPIRLPWLTSTDVAATKIGLVASGGPLETCTEQPVDPMITADSNRSVHNLTTSDWLYVCDPDSSQHLYSKPDDIDDFNDVARIRPDIVSHLESAQKNSASQ